MDKVCAICFDDMDMLSYQDERQSTSTSFKLECDHAFHTKCIVECLQKMNHKCPQCNSHKSPNQTLTMEGTICSLLDEVKRSKELKAEYAEFNSSRKQLSNLLKQLKKDTEEFVKNRKEELLIPIKRKEFNYSMRQVNSKIGRICKKRGGIYYGAYKNMPEWKRNRLVFMKSYNIYRLKNYYINCKV